MRLTPCFVAFTTAFALTSSVSAQSVRPFTAPGQQGNELNLDYFFQEHEDGSIVTADLAGTYVFAGAEEYFRSSFFQDHGLRCGSDRLPQILALGVPSDCSSSNTTIKTEYNPGATITINVWVHQIQNKRGTLGVLNSSQTPSQIASLNAAFSSLGVQFVLAGTTLSKNNNWYNDTGTYYNTLARDVTRNLNIYTNTASGNLGYAYVPSGGGVVGNKWDRVVIYYRAFGNPGTYGAPYNQGDTTVHEVGHYLGLYHTFQGGCAAASGCSNNGDLICDTNPEGSPNFSPCTRSSACGAWLDPTTNFMDYSDDACMFEFSSNQKNRMRCTLANYRTLLGQ